MIKTLSKILLVFVLITQLTVLPAYAALPALIPVASWVGRVVVLPKGRQWLLTAAATQGIPTLGRATASGVVRNGLLKIAPYLGIAVAGTMSYNEIRSKVAANPAAYPNLNNALNQQVLQNSVFPTDGSALPLGSAVVYNGQSYAVTGVRRLDNCTISTNAYYMYSPLWQIIIRTKIEGLLDGAHRQVYSQVSYTFNSTPLPPVNQEVPDPVFSTTISTPSLDELLPVYQNEIDALMEANPSSVQTPSTLDADYDAAVRQAAALNEQQAKQSALNSATAARDTAQANYNANPTPENKQKLDDAQAELDKLSADQAKDDSADVDDTLPEPEQPPTLKTFNFEPLKTVGAAFSGKFPFTIFSTISALASGLVSTPVAPSFTINFPAPFNYAWTVSLSQWDSWAQTLRFLIGAAFLVMVSMSIIRRWQ